MTLGSNGSSLPLRRIIVSLGIALAALTPTHARPEATTVSGPGGDGPGAPSATDAPGEAQDAPRPTQVDPSSRASARLGILFFDLGRYERRPDELEVDIVDVPLLSLFSLERGPAENHRLSLVDGPGFELFRTRTRGGGSESSLLEVLGFSLYTHRSSASRNETRFLTVPLLGSLYRSRERPGEVERRVLFFFEFATKSAVPDAETDSADRARRALLGPGDTFEWRGAMRPGATLTVQSLNGRVVVRPAPDREVQIEAKRDEAPWQPDEVPIRVFEGEEGITVCSVDAAGRCLASGDPTFLSWDVPVVRYEVRVPSGVRVVASTHNGRIRATGLDAAVEARTVNGRIEVETTSTARARTVRGRIRAKLGAEGPDDIRLETGSGRIELELPADVQGQLDASTEGGRIESAFGGEVEQRGPYRRRLLTTLGSDARAIRLRTEAGRIRVSQANAASPPGSD